MSGIDDDALREMLALRADRLSPGVAAEVMATVRTEIRGPHQGAAFSVLPVLTGRSPAIGAGWAAAAMIGVLVMVLVATRPPVASPSPSMPPSTPAAVPATSGSTTPSPAPGLQRSEAIRLARQYAEDVSPGAQTTAAAGRYGSLAEVWRGTGPAPSIPPDAYVWAVSFDQTEAICTSGLGGSCSTVVVRTAVYLDEATGAYLGIQTGPALPGRMSSLGLPLAVSDGSLDGHVVLVASTLRDAPTGCAAAPCPSESELDLVGPVVTRMRPGLPVVPAAPAAGSGPLTGTFVLVPFQGSLILVGRLEGSLGSPVSWTTLAHAYAPPDPGGEIALQAVSGWLTRNVGLPCPSMASPAAACGPFDELGDTPLGNGGPATIPRVDAPALGIDPATPSVPGPFLVRTGTGPSLELVGRYDLAAVTTVDTPPVACDVASGTPLPSCSVIASQALAALPRITAITSVEVNQGSYCPPGWTCPTVAADRAHVIVRTASGDWLVELAYGADGRLITATPAPMPSGSPSISFP